MRRALDDPFDSAAIFAPDRSERSMSPVRLHSPSRARALVSSVHRYATGSLPRMTTWCWSPCRVATRTDVRTGDHLARQRHGADRSKISATAAADQSRGDRNHVVCSPDTHVRPSSDWDPNAVRSLPADTTQPQISAPVRPSSAPRLRSRHSGRRDDAPDRDAAGNDVDVLPLQRQPLADSHAGAQRDEDHDLSLTICGGDEPLRLIGAAANRAARPAARCREPSSRRHGRSAVCQARTGVSRSAHEL